MERGADFSAVTLSQVNTWRGGAWLLVGQVGPTPGSWVIPNPGVPCQRWGVGFPVPHDPPGISGGSLVYYGYDTTAYSSPFTKWDVRHFTDAATWSAKFRQGAIVRRECATPTCSNSHKDVWYLRLTPTTGISNPSDLFLSNWNSPSNIRGVDFNLFSSLADLRADSNAWTYCNYDDAGIGFPRDCGPSGSTSSQSNSVERRTRTSVRFTIYEDGVGGASGTVSPQRYAKDYGWEDDPATSTLHNYCRNPGFGSKIWCRLNSQETRQSSGSQATTDGLVLSLGGRGDCQIWI